MRPTSLTATLAAALVGSALLVASPGANSAPPTRSSAYGVAVSGGGEQVVPPSPQVESRDGSTQTTGGSVPPEAAPLLAGGALELSAGDDRASVTVTDLAIGQVDALPPELDDLLGELQAGCEEVEGQLPELPVGELPEELQGLGLDQAQLETLCTALGGEFAALATLGTLQVSCEGDSGSVSALDASVVGVGTPQDLQDVAPDTKLFPENPLVDVTLNRQTAGPRGAFTVDGLVVSLAGGEGEAVVGSTTCGERLPRTATPRPTPTQAPPAPAPVPTRAPAPVTG